MRLMHYSELALPFGPMDYVQNELRAFGKPTGYWVSVQGEDDWPTWCRENEFMESSLAHAHEVTLAPGHNILVLPTVEDMRGFHDRYSVEDAPTAELRKLRSFSDEYVWKSRPIDWTAVTADHDGIIIAPYQWSLRMQLDWFYGWDCASGCIWNLSAIASVEARSELPAESPCL